MDHSSMADHEALMAGAYAFALAAILVAWVRDKSLMTTKTAMGLYVVVTTHPILMWIGAPADLSLIAFAWSFAVFVQALRATRSQ